LKDFKGHLSLHGNLLCPAESGILEEERNPMNRAGFTTVEVIIASALIVALVTAGTAGIRQMNLLSLVATTRTAHTEMRTKVLEAVSNSGACAGNISTSLLINPNQPLPIAKITNGATTVIDSSNTTVDADGLTYFAELIFPSPGATDSLPVDLGHAVATTRRQARLAIIGKRDNSTALQPGKGGALTDIVSMIPLATEFDVTGKLVGCTVNADEMDDILVAPPAPFQGHTVRQCVKNDGYPIPTAFGLICRLPVPYPTQNSGSPGTVPACNTLGDLTWREPIAGSPYSTTMPIDVTRKACSGLVTVSTGWHSMNRTGVEQAIVTEIKGTSNTLKYVLGGGAFTALVVVAFIPVLGTIIAAAALAIVFIFSLFHKCHNETIPIYAQVTGVGCI
jgi:hypothetical protein